MLDGVRLADFDDLGPVTEATRLIAESGRNGYHGMPALLAYLRGALGTGAGGGQPGPPGRDGIDGRDGTDGRDGVDGDTVYATGIVGDGQVDDAPALQAALDTGGTVIVKPGKVLRLAGPVFFRSPRQWFMAHGAKIVPTGNFDVFSCVGLEGCGVQGAYVEASGMTGGHVFSVGQGGVAGTGRFTVRDAIVWSPWRAALFVRTNWIAIENAWINNVRGDYGIGWYGDNATGKSDILRLAGCCIAGSASNKPVAVIMDGAVHSLDIQTLHCVNVENGLLVRNSAGAAIQPSFVMADGLSVDFPRGDAVRLEWGSHVYLSPQTYLHGSETGSGVHLSVNVPHDTVTIGGGKITGHARFGVETDGARRVKVGTSPYFSGNGIADWSNPEAAIHSAPRYEVAPNFYITRTSDGRPLINFDAVDYLVYNRDANALSLVIGGVPVLTIDGTGAVFGVPVQAPPG